MSDDDLERWFHGQPAEHKARLRKIAADMSNLNAAEVHPVILWFRTLQHEQRPHGAEWMKWRDAADEAEALLHPDLRLDYDLWHNSVLVVSGANMVVSGANMASADELRDAADRLEKLSGTGYYDDPKGDELLKHIAAYLRGKL